MRPSLAFVVLLFTACGQRQVSIRMLLPAGGGPAPVAGARVVVLPYDRDSLVAELESRAPTPRPDTGELDSLLATLDAARSRVGEARRAGGTGVDRAEAAYALVRTELTPRIDSLRAVVRAWEAEALGDYDSVAATLLRGLMRRQALVAHTDSTGTVLVVLPRGRWWVHARGINAADPYTEWYWNVPVRGDSVLLTPATGHTRPRY